MKLLVSARNITEAKSCIEGGADIVDIKNPKEGSLGGHSPVLINKIRKIVPQGLGLSAAVGDINNRPGLVSQAVFGLANCGLQYIKMGLCDCFSIEEAVHLVKHSVQAIKYLNNTVKLVICGYADGESLGLFSYKDVPYVVYKSGADVAMIDTFVKNNSKGLFDFVREKDLSKFRSQSREYKLEVALAGSLTKDDIIKIRNNNFADIVGIRSLACREGKRNNNIEALKVREIKIYINR